MVLSPTEVGNSHLDNIVKYIQATVGFSIFIRKFASGEATMFAVVNLSEVLLEVIPKE